jgi:hypothetical protein
MIVRFTEGIYHKPAGQTDDNAFNLPRFKASPDKPGLSTRRTQIATLLAAAQNTDARLFIAS